MASSKVEIEKLKKLDWQLRQLARDGNLQLTTDEGDPTRYQSLVTLLLFRSSKRLEKGTKQLMEATQTLEESSSRLETSSRRIEKLTWILVSLTTILAIVTAGLWMLELTQIFASQGLLLLAQASIAAMIVLSGFVVGLLWWSRKVVTETPR